MQKQRWGKGTPVNEREEKKGEKRWFLRNIYIDIEIDDHLVPNIQQNDMLLPIWSMDVVLYR